MPTIRTTKTGGKIIYGKKDWLSGLTTQNSTRDNFLGASLIDSTRMNPYRDLGIMQPGHGWTDVTNVATVTTVLKSYDIDASGQDIYAINETGEVHQISGTTGNVIDDNDWKHTIDLSTTAVHSGHSGLVGKSVALYNAKLSGTSLLRLFYAWKDGTDGDVGRHVLGGATFDDDFMSNAAGSGAVLGTGVGIMIVGDDDKLYIVDGRSLHRYDGQNGNEGTYTADAFTVPRNETIIALVKFNHKTLAVFTSTGNASNLSLTAKSRCYLWNYVDEDPYNHIDLEDNFVSAAFSWKGTIGCFTGRRRNPFGQISDAKIKLYDGSKFVTVAFYSGSLPSSDGIAVFPEQIMWNSDGQIYSYGSVYKGLDPAVHHFTKGGGGDGGGIIIPLTSSLILTSTGATTTGGLQKNDSAYIAGASFDTVWAYPPFPSGKVGKVNKVVVEFFGTSSSTGQGLTFELLLDDTSTNKTIFTDFQEVTSSSKNLIKEYLVDTSGNPFTDFQSLSLKMDYTAAGNDTDAPKVKRVIIYYNNIEHPKF